MIDCCSCHAELAGRQHSRRRLERCHSLVGCIAARTADCTGSCYVHSPLSRWAAWRVCPGKPCRASAGADRQQEAGVVGGRMAVEVCPETATYRRAEDMWPASLVAPASLEEDVSQPRFLHEVGHSCVVSSPTEPVVCHDGPCAALTASVSGLQECSSS
jgi:hypothetical protein